jgi:cell division septum initiation protein DivIVA
MSDYTPELADDAVELIKKFQEEREKLQAENRALKAEVARLETAYNYYKAGFK